MAFDSSLFTYNGRKNKPRPLAVVFVFMEHMAFHEWEISSSHFTILTHQWNVTGKQGWDTHIGIKEYNWNIIVLCLLEAYVTT